MSEPTLIERLRGDNCHCRMAREAADQIEELVAALEAIDSEYGDEYGMRGLRDYIRMKLSETVNPNSTS